MAFLSPFISTDRILNNALLQSKKRIFEMLSDLLQVPDQGISAHCIYQKLFERERIGSTAIGQGVVIPHCRVEGINITQMAVITLLQAIDYGAADNQPVDIFIAAIFPEAVKDVHITFMAELIKLLKQPGVTEKIRQASSSHDLYHLLTADTHV